MTVEDRLSTIFRDYRREIHKGQVMFLLPTPRQIDKKPPPNPQGEQ